MKRTSTPRHRRDAFTLIELLLAMTMVTLLALSLYSALYVAYRAQRSVKAAIEPMRTVSIAADLVRQDFEAVRPTGILAGSFVGVHQPGATGDNDTVQFYSIGRDEPAATDAPMTEGIRKIELLIRDDVNPPILVRRVTKNLLPSGAVDPEDEIICRDVRSFSLRYFDGAAWQESWDSTTLGDVLPMAVAVTVELNTPLSAQGNSSEPSRRISRVIPLACASSRTPFRWG